MALQKHKEDIYGDGGISYWKIVETNINWLERRSHIALAGYVSADSRHAGKVPMSILSYDWSGDDFPFGLEEFSGDGINPVLIAYEKIKERDEWFTDAIDC